MNTRQKKRLGELRKKLEALAFNVLREEDEPEHHIPENELVLSRFPEVLEGAPFYDDE